MTSLEKNKAIKRTNKFLRAINYADHIPVTYIDEILKENGFNETEPAVYCGRDGRSHEPVGEGVYLSLAWHKMEVSGRYEIVAYVNQENLSQYEGIDLDALERAERDVLRIALKALKVQKPLDKFVDSHGTLRFKDIKNA